MTKYKVSDGFHGPQFLDLQPSDLTEWQFADAADATTKAVRIHRAEYDRLCCWIDDCECGQHPAILATEGDLYVVAVEEV